MIPRVPFLNRSILSLRMCEYWFIIIRFGPADDNDSVCLPSPTTHPATHPFLRARLDGHPRMMGGKLSFLYLRTHVCRFNYWWLFSLYTCSFSLNKKMSNGWYIVLNAHHPLHTFSPTQSLPSTYNAMMVFNLFLLVLLPLLRLFLPSFQEEKGFPYSLFPIRNQPTLDMTPPPPQFHSQTHPPSTSNPPPLPVLASGPYGDNVRYVRTFVTGPTMRPSSCVCVQLFQLLLESFEMRTGVGNGRKLCLSED